ncbi:hypothetical protein NECAME_07519 [Necator americanus]|uniref:OCEL domain-containing protein n=1 Tax=Necator americanus TaxID=51031 RepID=W2TQ17_NECAM|nr:hypothetical protein NECAME_07519 [Necator americanus]ETN83221.1 hypothetical protein NECAME_07519 [Necator americanus]
MIVVEYKKNRARLESDCGDYESVVMVKLTDEMFSALMLAQRKGLPIRVHVDEQGGKWELGDPANGGNVFRYQQQALPGPPTDAVVHDPRSGTHRAVGAFRSKYQIQATDKSFADTRERAQKLIEEEKSRGTKDVTKHRQKGSLLKSGTPRVGSASSSRNVSPLLTRTLDTPSSRISPNKFANSTGSNGNASLQNGGSSGTPRATPTQHLNSELRKKKLRQRIIQLVVLGKFSGADLILRQLRKDGLNEEAGLERRVEDIVREVSEPSSGTDTTKIVLRPAFYGEVDTRWLWYNQEEKAYVRRVTQGLSSSQTKSSTFAPMRKSGMERMQAPCHSSTNSSSASGQTVSPEAIPTPPNSRPASAVSAPMRKTPPKNVNTVLNGSREQTPSSYRSPAHEATSVNKRKAHVPAQQRQPDGKRPRQESASPPEDPTNHPLHNQIKTVQEAEKYFTLFQQEYPEYLECYKTLNEVAKEFRQLEIQLKNAVDNRKDIGRIEQNIQQRFAQYDKDPEFVKTRQRYADLHSKLAVLKSRISDFERAQDMAASGSTTAVPMDLCDLE